MFVLYDVINHRWRVIWWTADKVRRNRANHQHMIAELPASLADAMVEKKLSRETFYEGIARYASRHI